MGPGHAAWALQAVWIWLPGWSLHVCLGWAGSVQAKWCEALSCILRSGGSKNGVLVNFKKSVIFDTKMLRGQESASEGGKAEKCNALFNMNVKAYITDP